MSKRFIYGLITFFFLLVFTKFGICQSSLNFTISSLTGGYTLTCSKPSLTFSITANTSNSLLCTWTSSQNTTLTGNPIVINNPDTYTVTVEDLVSIQTKTQALIVYQDTVAPKAIGGTVITLTCPLLHIDSYTCNLSPSFPTSTLNYTFHWDNMLGGVLTPTNLSQVIVDLPGTYSCFVTNSVNGCTTVATFSVYCNVGINENIWDNANIQIYPNPFTDIIFLNFHAGLFANRFYIVVFRNMYGQEVYETFINHHSSSVNLSFLPKGIYFVDVLQNDVVICRKKLIKQ